MVWAGRKTRVHLSRGSSSRFLFIGDFVLINHQNYCRLIFLTSQSIKLKTPFNLFNNKIHKKIVVVHYIFFAIRCTTVLYLSRKKVEFYQKRGFMIKRDNYLNQLIRSKNNGFPKVITGIRRCGKSFLIKEINIFHFFGTS